jgi:hypothetical protein
MISTCEVSAMHKNCDQRKKAKDFEKGFGDSEKIKLIFVFGSPKNK